VEYVTTPGEYADLWVVLLGVAMCVGPVMLSLALEWWMDR
jgi:hypothetical protein